MADFVNPGALGELAAFKRVYAIPVAKGRERGATPAEARLATSRGDALAQIISSFVLRRTSADVTGRHLPPKAERTIFLRPSPLQLQIYRLFAQAPFSTAQRSFKWSEPLPLILALRLLCCSAALAPELAERHALGAEVGKLLLDAGCAGGAAPTAESLCAASAKLSWLNALLAELRGRERIVVVSNFTKTLDVIEQLCGVRSWRCDRLDGSTAQHQRQQLVDTFNQRPRGDASEPFVLLLSSKAGGCGLNLVGGSRLVLFDVDWNPAVDEQAMARIWRDGQRAKTVFVYRLLCTGTIEEKVFQRQLQKHDELACVEGGNSDGVGGGGRGSRKRKKSAAGGSSGGGFSREELRQLFKLNETTRSETAELLLASSAERGGGAGGAESAHGGWDASADIADDAALQAAVGRSEVTFMFEAPASTQSTPSAAQGSDEEMEDNGEDDDGEEDADDDATEEQEFPCGL